MQIFRCVTFFFKHLEPLGIVQRETSRGQETRSTPLSDRSVGQPTWKIVFKENAARNHIVLTKYFLFLSAFLRWRFSSGQRCRSRHHGARVHCRCLHHVSMFAAVAEISTILRACGMYVVLRFIAVGFILCRCLYPF